MEGCLGAMTVWLPCQGLTVMPTNCIYNYGDFDPAKEAINLAKHRISLARRVELDMSRSSEMIGLTMAS
jgi:hypothetical protein